MRVKRTAAFVMGFRGNMVKPGLNNFTDAQAEVMRADPAFQEQIDLGHQTVIDDETTEDSMVEAVLAMNVKTATKAIKDILDIEVLDELAEREERVSVLKVIEKQQDVLRAEDD